MKAKACLVALLGLLLPVSALAHLGSKDIYEDVSAGPYRFFVTIRPPLVIPGLATVEIRSVGGTPNSIDALSVPMGGEGADILPAPEALRRSPVDPGYFSGDLWLMKTGSWRLQFAAKGPGGTRTVAVPVPAIAMQVFGMPPGTKILLTVLGLFLAGSLVAIVIAAVREARLEPGLQPPSAPGARLLSGAVSLLVIAGMAVIGGHWWKASASVSRRDVFQPLTLQTELHGSKLDLDIGTGSTRPVNDFIPDHGHLMHLYAVRQPGMDVVFHLHPEQVGPGRFDLSLPAMPAGQYTLYGDVVHANGFPETVVGPLAVPAGLRGRPLAGDDAEGTAAAVGTGDGASDFRLADGYTMVWDRPAALVAGRGYHFRFRLLDPSGKAAPDMQLYMGMTGHAAFLKTDGTVFAHVHPQGSAPMAALMLANSKDSMSDPMSDPMESMDAPSNLVEFPYGFPTPGRYRIFVQMKHGTTVETGVFDAVAR